MSRGLRKKLLSFWKNSAPFGLILVLVVIFFWKFFVFGMVPIPGDFVIGTYYPWLDYKWGYEVGVPVKNPITTDVVSFSFPMRIAVVRMFKSGQLPLWNPYILMGTPLLANFQSAPFSFTNIFYFLTDELNGWSLQVISQHLFAMLFMYVLLRYWKLGKPASLIGSVLYAFSGFNLIWSQWNSHTLVASFIPLLVFLQEKFITTFNKQVLIFYSIALALQIFAGYPQAVIYTFGALFIFWILRIREVGKPVQKTFYLILSGILGIGLSMVQIAPGAELLSLSQRSVELNPYNWAFLPPSKAITFVAPDFFGSPVTRNYWGPQDYTSNIGFVGVFAFIFAGFLLFVKEKPRTYIYLLILAALSLLMSFSTPLSKWLWDWGVLGLRAASAHRALVIWNFAVSAMSAFGYDYFVRNNFSKRNLGGFLLVFVLTISYLAYSFYNLNVTRQDPSSVLANGVNKYEVGLRNLLFPIFIFILCAIGVVLAKLRSFRKLTSVFLFVVGVAELFRFGWKFTPFTHRNLVYPTTPVIEFLENLPQPTRITGLKVIPMNMRMQYGLESPEGYDAVYPQRVAQFLASLGSSDPDATLAGRYGFVDNERSHLMDLVNTKYLLAVRFDAGLKKPSSSGDIPANYLEGNELAFEDGSTVVLKSKDALERAFMVYDWEVIREDRKILETLLDKNFPIGKKIILEEDVSLTASGEDIENKVSYIEYKETRSVIKVNSARPGMLFVSDSFYPGWKAYVDGREEKIFRADYTFRAVKVGAGNHIIEFRYHPDSFEIGLVISAFSFCLLLLYTYSVGRKNKVGHA